MLNQPVEGLSVFVVEDEALVLMNLEDMLLEMGCTVVGPAMRIGQAEQIVSGGVAADVALLDVNVAGELVFPLARRLAEHGMPILFATGYGRAGLPDDLGERPVLQKPYTANELFSKLCEATGRVPA